MHMGGIMTGLLENAAEKEEMAEVMAVLLQELEKQMERKRYSPKGEVLRAMHRAQQMLQGGF